MRKKPILIVACALCCGVLALWLLGIFSHRPRALLPRTATEIREFNRGIGNFTGDYFYLLKAKINEEGFNEYVSKLEFVPLTTAVDYQGRPYHWGDLGNRPQPWWDPSPSSDKAFVPPYFQGSRIAIVKYEDAYVYYKETGGL